jgi:hypothetical protein
MDMARKWLSAFLWSVVWTGIYMLVLSRRGPLWLCLSTQAAMGCCMLLLVGRTACVLFGGGEAYSTTHPAVRYRPDPTRVRRVIFEEEEPW